MSNQVGQFKQISWCEVNWSYCWWIGMH